MKQNDSLKSDDGQMLQAAQITLAKQRQSENARARSKQPFRQTSSASTSNSEVTERPPQVYQAPQINVPENLHEAAKLIHDELSKIAQSQSIILTLWEAYEKQKDQITELHRTIRELSTALSWAGIDSRNQPE